MTEQASAARLTAPSREMQALIDAAIEEARAPLLAQIDTLRQEQARLTQQLADEERGRQSDDAAARRAIEAVLAREKVLRQDRDAARAALKKHGVHMDNCKFRLTHCTCGLDAALKAGC